MDEKGNRNERIKEIKTAKIAKSMARGDQVTKYLVDWE
jgi:hypothetical protein